MNKLPLTKRWKSNLSELFELPEFRIASPYKALIGKLNETLEQYLDEQSIADIYQATLYGAEAHKGQKRISGEDYIHHPIAVAHILGEMRMDSRTIIAAILHDVVEDTPVTVEDLNQNFGKDIAALVDGVSKVGQLEMDSREHAEAASFRKMFMAMAKDIRVIIIKLADRLHNMHTLDSLRTSKQRNIAKQTLDIYAPIANRLGMREMANELETLSLYRLYPNRCRTIEKAIQQANRGRKSATSEACKHIRFALKQNKITVEVDGREKSLYSIYNKMRQKQKSLKELTDIHAIRVITERRPNCYEAMGVIHKLYKPVPGTFKDYIAIPKVNGYQSIHTIVVGPDGRHIEVQIRSQPMHKAAEKGLASHWIYKTETTSEHAPQQIAQQWLDSFLESQDMSSDSGDYLEHLKADLFPDEVYVFTPKGDIKRLPRSSTALDFAYAVHSKVGDKCVGAKINGSNVPLHERLSNGDHVEILTSRNARPVPSWLDYTKTSKARASIRHYLNKQQYKEALKLGRRLLKTALKKEGYRWMRTRKKDEIRLLETLNLEHRNQLFTDIGFGKRTPYLVAKQLISACGEDVTDSQSKDMKNTVTIEGTEKLLTTYASCCYPIRGDAIIGTTTNRGLVVHRSSCKNRKTLTRNPENLFHLNWSEKISNRDKFQAKINIITHNQPGVLASISNIIAKHNSNINSVTTSATGATSSIMSFIIEVDNRKHLANILRRLHGQDSIIKLTRV